MTGAGRFLVLGAGPAGLWAALRLAERGFDVEVVERHGAVGGNAGSFTLHGLRVDFGSHRLHPATDPVLLERLRRLLGDDLLERPRHGRIRLLGRWIHFPLRPLDLALRVPPRFALGVARDVVAKALRSTPPASGETFGAVLERGLGRTICREFYFPYAEKLWGLGPDEISPVQARRRVSASTVGQILTRLLPVPGRGAGAAAKRKRIFYYPRGGYGQISERVGEAAVAAGARLRLGAEVRAVRRVGSGLEVEIEAGAASTTLAAERVWSTIPVPHLARLADPPPPPEVREAAAGLSLRAMVLVYLVLDRDRFSEWDAHYFPGREVPFTRLSEPKVYADRTRPVGKTVLCAEIPCAKADPVWAMGREELGRLVADGMRATGLDLEGEVVEVEVRRLGQVYPVYDLGFESRYETLDRWVSGLDGVLSFGRQGLFAHDNTHHAIATAEAAVDCLDERGALDVEKWRRYREVFATHVVED